MAEFIKVASTSDLPPGEKMLVEYDDEDVGLFNINGEVYAISDVCTHDDGPLVEGRLDGDCIICPRHGARFNVKTGKQTLFRAPFRDALRPGYLTTQPCGDAPPLN